MKKIQLNIGLENNPYSFDEVKIRVNVYLSFGNYEARQEVGEYDGNEERTFVASLDSSDSVKEILQFIEHFTEYFTQDCIAVKIDGKGYLVYNPSFEGDRLEFDDKYFIV
jgi:hypothetical protein